DVLGPTTVSGQDGTTGAKQVDPNTYYLSENLTNASGYTSSISCFNDKNQNGTQDSGESTVTATAASPGWSGPLGVGDHIVCTITNTQIPQVKVNKTLVPSSDTGRFDLQVDGSSPNAGSTNVGDGGTTGFVNETVGATPTVGEVGHTGTDLGNYISSISCSNG